MKRDRNALTAGLFIVFSFVAAVVCVVLIRGDAAGPTRTCSAVFKLTDDLSGLAVGDEVRIGGFKVGTVHAIDLHDLGTAEPRVVVSFSLPTTYVLYEDAQLGVQAALTGRPNLNIYAVGAGKPLADGKSLVGAPDAKTTLIATLSRIAPRADAVVSEFQNHSLPRLNDAVDSATQLFQHANGKIDSVVDKYNAVALHADELLTQVRDLVGDSKTDLRGTLKNINVSTAAVREKLPPLMDKLTAAVDKVDESLVNSRTIIEDVRKAAANARDLTNAARSVVVDNQSRLDNIVKGLKATSDNLRATSVEVRHSPWRLLYKPAPEEMGNLNLFDSAREFAEGAAAMNDAALALRDAMKAPDADKTKLQKLVNRLDDSFHALSDAETKLRTSVKQ